jgi:hypothetical protein
MEFSFLVFFIIKDLPSKGSQKYYKVKNVTWLSVFYFFVDLLVSLRSKTTVVTGQPMRPSLLEASETHVSLM